MTCIVGIVDEKNGKIYMGCDSAGISGLNIRERKDKEIFIKDDKMIFAFCGSFRMADIIKYHFVIPNKIEGQTDKNYLHTTFLDSLIESLNTNKLATIVDNEIKIQASGFLLGYKNNLYKIHSDFQIEELYINYNAAGCGEDYALGALFALEGDDLKPKEKIKIALTAASKFSAGVCPPFIIKEL